MITKSLLEEVCDRVDREIIYFGGSMPERVAIAWYGYLAALLEWGQLSPAEHQQVSEMLPKIDDNPVMAIFLGR